MKRNAKLFSAAMMLLLSLVMLVGASLAWFTVSTAPEISGMQVTMYTDLDLMVSKTEDGEFSQSITTEKLDEFSGTRSIDDLPYYAPLKPVSTVDGIHWFMPAYNDADGSLKDVTEFIPATDANCNVVLDESQEGTTDYFATDGKGYYVCADIWLKTENQNGVAVTLSVPQDRSSLQAWEIGQGEGEYAEKHSHKYGSYALGKYALVEENVARIDNNVQTALRVGFLVEEEVEGQEEKETVFTIWEPNADQRSDIQYKPKANSSDPAYILEYDLVGESNYADGQYIITKPIGLDEDGHQAVVNIPPERLMVQLKSSWSDAIKEGDNWAHPTSEFVGTFGKFITDTQDLYDLAPNGVVSNLNNSVLQGLASNSIITTLKPNEAKKVTVYFWLEGQDVDCWNDIASGSFFINLEFAAQDLP